jgi:hypothetical protein
MKKMGIIQVPSSGKVSWLTKEINDSFVKNELENLERKIYDLMAIMEKSSFCSGIQSNESR